MRLNARLPCIIYLMQWVIGSEIGRVELCVGGAGSTGRTLYVYP